MDVLVLTTIGCLVGLLVDHQRGCFPDAVVWKASPPYKIPARPRARGKRPVKSSPKTKEIATLGGTVAYREKPTAPSTRPASPPPSKAEEKAGPAPSLVPPPPPKRPDWVTTDLPGAQMNLVKKRPDELPPQGGKKTIKPLPQSLVQEQVPEHLIGRVTSLTHNRSTSARLLLRCRERNRHRDWNWVAEKVCYDLTRDRK